MVLASVLTTFGLQKIEPEHPAALCCGTVHYSFSQPKVPEPALALVHLAVAHMPLNLRSDVTILTSCCLNRTHSSTKGCVLVVSELR